MTLRRSDVERSYQDLTGWAPRDMDFYLTYAAIRHAIIMARIKRRMIHFGEDQVFIVTAVALLAVGVLAGIIIDSSGGGPGSSLHTPDLTQIPLCLDSHHVRFGVTRAP